MRHVALAVLVAIGCGTSDDDPLDGTAWGVELSTACASGLVFQGGTYRDILFCSLTDGTFGLQEANGTYEINGDRLTMHMDRASCNWLRDTATVSWVITASGTLRLQNSSVVVVFERLTAGGGSFVGQFGCFDDAGGFAAMPVHAL
jgi:hypothetical protein